MLMVSHTEGSIGAQLHPCKLHTFRGQTIYTFCNDLDAFIRHGNGYSIDQANIRPA
jgi:hypothetical protein